MNLIPLNVGSRPVEYLIRPRQKINARISGYIRESPRRKKLFSVRYKEYASFAKYAHYRTSYIIVALLRVICQDCRSSTRPDLANIMFAWLANSFRVKHTHRSLLVFLRVIYDGILGCRESHPKVLTRCTNRCVSIKSNVPCYVTQVKKQSSSVFSYFDINLSRTEDKLNFNNDFF